MKNKFEVTPNYIAKEKESLTKENIEEFAKQIAKCYKPLPLKEGVEVINPITNKECEEKPAVYNVGVDPYNENAESSKGWYWQMKNGKFQEYDSKLTKDDLTKRFGELQKEILKH